MTALSALSALFLWYLLGMDRLAVLILIAVGVVGVIPRRQTDRVPAGNFLLNPATCFPESTLYRILHRLSVTTSSIRNGLILVGVIAPYISSFRVRISRTSLVNRRWLRRFRSLVQNFLVRVRRR